MIKLPKEVNKTFKIIEEAGFQVYAVGGCVRDSIMGRKPLDWDLSTDAKLEDLKKIFPHGKVISESLSVIRLEEAQEGNEDAVIVDVATFRTEGKYSDYRRPDEVEFTDDINQDLERRDFTINAMADNPSKTIVDPFGGKNHIKERLLHTIGDPLVRFEEDPIRMMRAVRFAAELDFDLTREVYEAIVKCAHLLEKVSVDAIRGEFEKILIAEHAGKGLRMMAGAELMPAIVGNAAGRMTHRQLELFGGLADGIDKTKKDLTRSLGLFYRCFEKKGVQAIERLHYDAVTHQHLMDALTQTDRIFFLADKFELKRYIIAVGMDRYEYLHNLAKAHHIVYGKNDVKVENRNYLMEQIISNEEPIFIEDLAIDGNDLIDAGIAEGPKVGQLLNMLTDVVHRKPSYNNRKDLLAHAKKFEKSKLKATFRGVKWLK